MVIRNHSVDDPTAQLTPDLYPAPHVVDGGTVTEGTLRELLLESSEPKRRSAILQSLGNILLREGSLREAATLFSEALAIDENNPELRVNHAVALFFLDEDTEATRELRRAQLLDPNLTLAQLYRGRIAMRAKQYEDAISAYEKVLESSPSHEEALVSLAHACNQHGSTARARTLYEELIKQQPGNAEAQEALALDDYHDGARAFQDGDLDRAFAIWGASYQRWPRPFVSLAEIHRSMRALIAEYRTGERFTAELKQYHESFRAHPDDKRLIYPVVSRFLFLEGLMPEAYEEIERLGESEARWRRSLEERGEHPYPHFRFALIHLYRGELEQAINELAICQDRFPPKKQRVLKITELMRFAQQLREIHERRDEYLNLGRSVDEWADAGFTDPFQLRAWKESGLAPNTAAIWREANFSPKSSYQWHKAGVSSEEARRWSDAGFEDPREVKNWIRSDFQPDEANAWRVACPLPQDLIIQCRKAGFEDPAVAYRWLQVLTLPLEAVRWHELGFGPEEAILWKDAGFTEPHQAQQYKSRGLSPEGALKEYNERN